MLKKPYFLLLIGVMFSLFIVACSETNEVQDEKEDVFEDVLIPDEENVPDTDAPEEESNMEEAASPGDEDLTAQLLEEDGVRGGQVYVDGDTVVATMMLEAELDQDSVTALAERYADQIKDEHADKKVNVQAIQDGENVANITLD
ncbi:hypothetical protein [Bacillus solitudinis]|uniref:hypothetical protein n=1 Tax=Bacillus solitudinis TaxID=2014074 RepID=UPI000C2479DB|nr:hypothetical protein [Bacillus solitudinis]